MKGFRVEAVNKQKPLWAETSIIHALTWRRDDLFIDKYVVTNISDEDLVIEEREFSNLGRNTRAISIRDHQLKPAQTTVLYLFRSGS